MNERQSEAIASLCLMAAFADGEKVEPERERMKRIFESLQGPDHASVYQRVLLKQATVASEAGALDTAELRTLAFELAVGVCDADGSTSPAERAFLKELGQALGIERGRAERVVAEADALADAPLERPLAELTAAVPASAVAAPPAAPSAPAQPPADANRERDVDDLILKTAMMCGGLELLPQSMATLGIVPLQTKLVHDVGLRYGYRLDRGHIMEFIATVGAGMTSQVVEGYARKFLGKLAKKQLGWLGGAIAGTATGAAMSFAATWAIGQVAKQYYAGGRKLAAIDLQRIYQEQLGRGRDLYAQHAAQREGSASATGVGGSPSFIDLDQLFSRLRR